jgi:hypothetical protein
MGNAFKLTLGERGWCVYQILNYGIILQKNIFKRKSE